MPEGLDRNAIGYLIGLVRQDIRKHEKSITGFAPRPGQSQDEAGELLAKWKNQQDYRWGVKNILRDMDNLIRKG